MANPAATINKVWILKTLYDRLTALSISPELLRSEFSSFKAGDEYDHPLFCHDVGPNPGKYLRHVHFKPFTPADAKVWDDMYEDDTRYHRRTSDCYVLYAESSTNGFLVLDLLQDPGAHDLWKLRYTKLAKAEEIAESFCVFGLSKIEAA